MGLHLIKKDERLEYVGDGFKILYRRIPTPVRGRFTNKHTKRGGETDWAKATLEMLEYSILGWSGVYETNGAGKSIEIPFDTEKVRSIPDDVLLVLLDLIGANAEKEEVEAGNWSTTSSSSEITPASPAADVE
jgi:hypothetical protein